MSSERLVVREVAGFSLVRALGAGGMGKVFLARQKSLDRLVALKVLQPKLASDQEFLSRFHREAKAAALFQHPNVAAVIDAGQDPRSGVHYIAFEFVDGGSLEDLLRKQPRLPEEQALFIARGMAQALAYAESKGLVHRDVKPDNILLSTDGTPKLADLGLAKQAADPGANLTQTGVVMGTPLYMAPEQALGEEPLDVRADIYALGLCLWRMLTGIMPFDEDGTSSSLAILTKHINEDLPDVRSRAPHVSEDTATLLLGMTARDRADRYRHAAALAKDIDRLLAGEAPLGPNGGCETTVSFDAVPRSEQSASSRRTPAKTARAASSRRSPPHRAAGLRGAGPPPAAGIPLALVAGVLIGALGIGVGLAVALAGGSSANFPGDEALAVESGSADPRPADPGSSAGEPAATDADRTDPADPDA
ncbi:MAG: serine/threonine protein kinase, partial [Planctomycetota bacterium]